MINLKPTIRQREFIALQKKYKVYNLYQQPRQRRLDSVIEHNKASIDIMICLGTIALGILIGFLTPLFSDTLVYFFG